MKIFCARAGNYIGTWNDDHGLKPTGREQAQNLALQIKNLAGDGKVRIVSGLSARMRQSAEIVAATLNSEQIVSDAHLDLSDGGAGANAIHRQIVYASTARITTIVFFGYADSLDEAVRALGQRFSAFQGLRLPSPPEGAAQAGSGFCSDLGEGQSWYVDPENLMATVIGEDSSESIGRPGDRLIATRT